jgi:hypothetical protein
MKHVNPHPWELKACTVLVWYRSAAWIMVRGTQGVQGTSGQDAACPASRGHCAQECLEGAGHRYGEVGRGMSASTEGGLCSGALRM